MLSSDPDIPLFLSCGATFLEGDGTTAVFRSTSGLSFIRVTRCSSMDSAWDEAWNDTVLMEVSCALERGDFFRESFVFLDVALRTNKLYT
jgi:hypothetical protein